MKIVVAITGASGVVIGQRLLEELSKKGVETHLIVSSGAADVAEFEECVGVEEIKSLASSVYDEHDLTSRLASSSFIVDAMVIVPCSMKTLSAVANGFSDNLITRAAENVLKMKWKMIVVPRDTPLSLAAIENMRKLKLSGAIIMPPNLAYYSKPKTMSDATDFIVGKIMDALGIGHSLYLKWGDSDEP
ncbi:MAG: UbiX family flavin prenyltransferase [Candidatus Altiarchaeota archaeon]